MDPLSHAHEPEPAVFSDFIQVKPHARVADLQLNLVSCTLQFHRKSSHPAVFQCVVQRFLYDSKQAQRNISWQRARNVLIGKLDVHSLGVENSLQKLLTAAIRPR